MIKKIAQTFFSFAIFLGLASGAANAQNSEVTKKINVTGNVQFVSPTTPNMVYLLKESMTGKPVPVDSVVVDEQNKSFSFVLNQSHPGIYRIDAFGWDQASFWSDADVSMTLRGYDTGRFKMKIPHYNYVDGSMDNNFINLYEQIGQLHYLRMVDEFNQEYAAKQHKETDSAWVSYLSTRPRYDSLQVDYRKRKDVLLKVFEGRPVLLYALRENISPDRIDKYDEVMQVLDLLIERYPWLTEASEAKNTITSNMKLAASLQPGKLVPSISYPDDKGKLQGLEKYKGKYLLMDFWASWCGPCRAAVPKVKELYNEYKASGFDVVSISIDTDEEAWRKAMKEEQMPWEQLLSPDLEKTMKLFQFSGIPTLYLLDPEGKIMDKFVGYSPDTEKKIKSILKNKETAPAEKKVMRAMSF